MPIYEPDIQPLMLIKLMYQRK